MLVPLQVFSAEEEDKALFLKHCASCHGIDATGRTAPNIVGSDVEDIADAIWSEADMTFMRNKVDIQMQKAIAEYLLYLEKHPL